MKAVLYDRTNAKEVADKSDLPKPTVGKAEVLVKVRAAAVNPVDFKLPHIPFIGRTLQGKPVGFDFSGVVEEIGPDVKTLKVGDEIYGNNRGTLVEYLSADESKVAKKPANASFEEAAGLPTVALTSYQALRQGNVKEGSQTLILGGSGGTGAMGIMIGKAMGAHVTSNCSTKNVEIVKGHGADVVYDYTSQEIPADPKFDCIYDTVTSPDDVNYQPLQQTHLKPSGEYVCINGFVKDWLKHFLLPRWLVSSPLLVISHSAADLTQIATWVDEGKVRPQLQEVLPFSQEGLVKAFDMLKSRRATGKLVFKISE